MSASPAGARAGLSVFFPAYNDSGTNASMVIRTVKTASELTSDFEIIVVDDGSADGTADIADELARTYPQVRAVHHPINRDYGAALQTGFRAATKELIFYTDGDAQYDPTELSVLWAKMTADADLVNGYKISRSDVFYRIWIGNIYLWAVKRLFRLKIRDVDCDFRLVKRSFLNGITLNSTSGTICVELVRKLQDTGCEIVEVPVRHLPRLYGRSRFFRPSRSPGRSSSERSRPSRFAPGAPRRCARPCGLR